MIAIIYEGTKTEPQIFKNIAKKIFPDREFTEIALEAAYNGNIFDFCNSIQLDPDVDIISQIQDHINRTFTESKKRQFTEFLKKSRDDFEAVYLFFDFDLQHDLHNAGSAAKLLSKDELIEKLSILRKMLLYFNNETENGKLYINYPMVESIKDLRSSNVCSFRCCENINNIKLYKINLNNIAKEFQNVSKYEKHTWAHFAKHAVQKANCIINDRYVMPSYKGFIDFLTQYNLFEKQETLVLNYKKCFIINSIPLFLVEYLGERCWEQQGLLSQSNGDFSLVSN